MHRSLTLGHAGRGLGCGLWLEGLRSLAHPALYLCDSSLTSLLKGTAVAEQDQCMHACSSVSVRNCISLTVLRPLHRYIQIAPRRVVSLPPCPFSLRLDVQHGPSGALHTWGVRGRALPTGQWDCVQRRCCLQRDLLPVQRRRWNSRESHQRAPQLQRSSAGDHSAGRYRALRAMGSWAGSPGHKAMARRSCPWVQYTVLQKVPS